jgi:ATP-dependent protease ClpP protease subunit
MYKVFIIVLLLSLQAAAGTILLTPENTLTIRGVVSPDAVADWSTQLVRMHLARKSVAEKIYLVMDTPGGSVTDGLDFITLVRTIPNVETVTIFAASMGSGIVEGVPGKRHIASSGLLMFHRATISLQGQINDGELESRLAMVKKIVNVLEAGNYKRMKMSSAAYKAAIKDELWLLGDEAVKQNAADSVDDITCSRELLNSTISSTVSFFGFTIKIKSAACPLMRQSSVAPADKDAYAFYQKHYLQK